MAPKWPLWCRRVFKQQSIKPLLSLFSTCVCFQGDAHSVDEGKLRSSGSQCWHYDGLADNITSKEKYISSIEEHTTRCLESVQRLCSRRSSDFGNSNYLSLLFFNYFIAELPDFSVQWNSVAWGEHILFIAYIHYNYIPPVKKTKVGQLDIFLCFTITQELIHQQLINYINYNK